MENNTERNVVSEGCEAQVEIGSRAWLLETQIETFEKIIQMTKRKNADYAGNGGDAFNNFTRVEGLCPTISTEQGFFVRLTDKFSRIGSFIQNGELQVKDESVEDTLLDLSNYAFLFYAFLRAKKLKAEVAEKQRHHQVRIFEESMKYREIERNRCEKVDVKESSPERDTRKEIDLPRWLSPEQLRDEVTRLEKNNANLIHENKRLALDNIAYKHLGTPSQIQVLFAKMDQVLNEKLEHHVDGTKTVTQVVPRDHKTMLDLNAGAAEGGCQETYGEQYNNGLEHN